MTLNRHEATRLANECLPLLHQSTSLPTNNLHITEKDITVQTQCRLWAGMGYIYNISIGKTGEQRRHRIIVKRILPPPKERQSFGDKRKADSYECEANFYENVARDLIARHDLCIPTPYYIERSDEGEITICMSRLTGRSGSLTSTGERHAVLLWMAKLHSATWGSKAAELVEGKGLQPIGSYWHLDTRPDEHDSMPRRGWEGRLKKAARAIDERLKRDRMQCCIHGDAKDANMLFFENEKGEVCVGMYDFQYCGKAPPSVDLAYFLCVAVGETECNDHLLRFYHEQLLQRLPDDEMKPSFRELQDSVALAFCDFQRFMSGWGNWGCDLTDIVKQTLLRLDGGKELRSEDEYREAMLREFG